MSIDPAAVRAPERALPEPLRTASAWLVHETGPVSLFSVSVALTLVMLPHQLLLDGWLTLVSGREVVEHGLPSADTLSVWTQGAEWVDQQWLAQAVFYGLSALGGIKLVMLGHAAIVAATLGLALVAARRLGGATRNVALVGTAAALVTPWAIQMRTQSLAMPLFVLLLWLLASDSRTPSRRVFLVFPLLALWANLHGTVVVAALFVSLRGLTYAAAELRSRGSRRSRSARRWLPRALVLTLAPFACVFASPYALELGGYYRSLFFNPTIHSIAPEWGPSTPSVWTAMFYVLGAASIWLLARRRSRLTFFEQAALLATVAAGALAIRSLMWFALATILFVPRLLDDRPEPREGRRSSRLGLAAGLAGVALAAVLAVMQPASWYTSSWPDAAEARVAQLAAERPGALIFADGRYASWLLWERPELAGRVSHDVRWELYTDAQLRLLVDFDDRKGDWRRATRGYDVLVLDRRTHPAQIEALRTEPGVIEAWADRRLVVLARG